MKFNHNNFTRIREYNYLFFYPRWHKIDHTRIKEKIIGLSVLTQ